MEDIDYGVIEELIRSGKRDDLKKVVTNSEVGTLARIIDQLVERDKIKFYLYIPTKKSSDVLLEVGQYSRKYILKSLKDKYIVGMIKDIESDDSADILGEVPPHKAKRIIANLPEDKQDAIAPLIKYEEDTAGGLMQSELISLQSPMNVKDALLNVRNKFKGVEGVNYIYVVDKKNKLKGVVTIQELLSAKRTARLSQIMKKDLVKLTPDLDTERVAEIFRKHDIYTLPVVDFDERLLGRVTVDDVLDVMEDEATEDMYKIAGVHPDEHLFDPVKNSIKRRLPWLTLNLGTAFVGALIVSFFSSTLEAVIILAAFMPMIAGLGGNSGTQTLTVIIRGLALNQIDSSNARKLIFRESFIGMVNGMFLGSIMGVVASIWQSNYTLGFVIFAAMTISLSLAGFIAASVPLMLKSFKIDPAIASSVFITASIDIIGFFSFLGIASLLVGWLV